MENKPDQKVLSVLALIHSGFLPTLMDIVVNKIGNTNMSGTLENGCAREKSYNRQVTSWLCLIYGLEEVRKS